MESLVVTWRELLIVVIAVLVVYAAEVLLLLHWSGKQGLRPRGLLRPWARVGATQTILGADDIPCHQGFHACSGSFIGAVKGVFGNSCWLPDLGSNQGPAD